MTVEAYDEAAQLWKAEANIKIPITVDDIECVMVGALEGGSNYWIDQLRVADSKETREPTSIYVTRLLAKGKSVRIKTNESFEDDDEGKWYELTADKLAKGIQQWCNLRVSQGKLRLDEKSIDWGRHDADDCDLCLQYALFNEVVFN